MFFFCFSFFVFHLEFVMFLLFYFILFFFAVGRGDHCVVFQVMISYESFVYNDAVKSAQRGSCVRGF